MCCCIWRFDVGYRLIVASACRSFPTTRVSRKAISTGGEDAFKTAQAPWGRAGEKITRQSDSKGILSTNSCITAASMPKLPQITNLYVIAGLATIGGLIQGFDVSSLSAIIGTKQVRNLSLR